MPVRISRIVRIAAAFIIVAVLSQGKSVIAQQALKLGVHPYLASSELIKRFTPLADYLSGVLKRPVTIELSSSYNAHIQKIGNNKLHIAFMGPASYVLMTEQFGNKPVLAGFESNGKKTFHGVIVTNKDSRITSLKQLKGKRFAFGDYDSTMSHLVPRFMLLEQGVDVSDLATHMHLATHDNIALSVLAGNFDAGAVKEEVYLKYRSEGLRAIAFTPEISDHVFVASSLLTKQTLQALRRALLGLKDHAEGRRILSTLRADVTGLAPVEDADYDNLREIISSLREAGVSI